jgi:hypothetical protein
VPSIAAKFLDRGMLAFDARHGAFPLEFWREKPENGIGFRSWLTPRFGLAPQPASTGSGAYSQSIKSSWRFDCNFYGHSDRNSHVGCFLSESPVLAGLSHLVQNSPSITKTRQTVFAISVADKFTRRLHSLHRVMDCGGRIRESIKVKTHACQHALDLARLQRFSGETQNRPNNFRQTYGRLLKLLLSCGKSISNENLRERLYLALQFHYLHILEIAFANCRLKLSLLALKALAYFLVLRHTLGVYMKIQSCQAKSEAQSWDDLIEFTEAKIKELQDALKTFRLRKETNLPWENPKKRRERKNSIPA